VAALLLLGLPTLLSGLLILFFASLPVLSGLLVSASLLGAYLLSTVLLGSSPALTLMLGLLPVRPVLALLV